MNVLRAYFFSIPMQNVKVKKMLLKGRFTLKILLKSEGAPVILPSEKRSDLCSQC